MKKQIIQKNIEIHFCYEGEAIEVIYDFEKADFMINTPGQEMVCFTGKTIDECNNTITALNMALTYIEKFLHEDTLYKHNKRDSKGDKKKSKACKNQGSETMSDCYI